MGVSLLPTSAINNSMIALLLCSLIVAAAAPDSCQEPGKASLCHSDDPDLPAYVTFAPCCEGSECLPVVGSDARFCQIPVGGDCSGMRGSCQASSTCVDGVCA